MKLNGDELSPSQYVTVDGKNILVMIKEIDIEEGYVDILIPIIPIAAPSLTADDAIKIAEGQEEEFSKFDYEVKRLTGKIEIKDLSVE